MKMFRVAAVQKRRAIRLLCVVAGVAAATWGSAPAAQDPALKKLLMLDFELVDSMQEVPFPDKQTRLVTATVRLRDAFIRERFYQVLDTTPVLPQIRSAQASYSLVDCNGCELEIARAAGADRVLVGWVQRVSNLILNINIEIRDAASGKIVLAKSVDLRGNNDASWQRGIDFMVRDIRDKQQGNR